MTQFLASAAHAEEAHLLARMEVDIVDLKDPAQGALGAWPLTSVRALVGSLAAPRVSATVGDLPMDPEVIRPAVDAMAETGVNFVKIGFFEGGDWSAVRSALAPLAKAGAPMVAVLFADQRPDLGQISAFRDVGFLGVMLDTADKRRGRLVDHLPLSSLSTFIDEARAAHLLTGLAGSLRLEDLRLLSPLSPDYLGFRGALCQGGRTGALCPLAIAAIKRGLTQSGVKAYGPLPSTGAVPCVTP